MSEAYFPNLIISLKQQLSDLKTTNFLWCPTNTLNNSTVSNPASYENLPRLEQSHSVDNRRQRNLTVTWHERSKGTWYNHECSRKSCHSFKKTLWRIQWQNSSTFKNCWFFPPLCHVDRNISVFVLLFGWNISIQFIFIRVHFLCRDIRFRRYVQWLFCFLCDCFL